MCGVSSLSMHTYDPCEHVRELWTQNRYFRDLLVAVADDVEGVASRMDAGQGRDRLLALAQRVGRRLWEDRPPGPRLGHRWRGM